MKSEIYIFKSPGFAAIIMHQNKPASIFKHSYSFVGEDINLDEVARKISSEIKETLRLTAQYPSLDKESLYMQSNTHGSSFIGISKAEQDIASSIDRKYGY